MNNSGKSAVGGVGFFGLLTIAFIVLKLVGVIKWSWIWVLSPIWLSAILLFFILFMIIMFSRR